MDGVTIVRKTVVEGLSRNVNIPCNLHRPTNSLPYWNISGYIYELFSLPSSFKADGPEAITIPTVDRSLDSLTLQCLVIDTDSDEGFMVGQFTILTVVSGKITADLDSAIILFYFTQPMQRITKIIQPHLINQEN